MVKYTGDQVEVRMATTEEGLASAPVVTNITSIEYDVEQNINREPKGLGLGREKEVKEGLIDRTGSMTRYWDKVAVVPSPGTTTFAQMVGAYETGDLTRLYIQVKEKVTGHIDTLKKAVGKYHKTDTIEGYREESYDFSFEELVES